jgi:nucleoid-associated protein YejK
MNNNNTNEGDPNPNLNEEGQPEPVVVNEQDAQVQQLIQDQVRQQVQQLMQQQAQAGQQVVLKSLSKWATRGLDLSEAGFSKLHSQEQKYNDDKPKYNLEPDKFTGMLPIMH